LTHVRKDGAGLANTPDFDADTFADTVLAHSLSTSTQFQTGRVLNQFAIEMNARDVVWITKKEEAGDPFAARSLHPAALVEAARFYFAETGPVFLFSDNGYIKTIVGRGQAAIYQQIALWLRQVATMQFSDNPALQQVSAQLFGAAADSAQSSAANLGAPHPAGDGLFPGSQDFV
jgi:hypothetical protein